MRKLDFHVISACKYSRRSHSYYVLQTHTHTLTFSLYLVFDLLTNLFIGSHSEGDRLGGWGRRGDGSGLEQQCCKGLWETVERPMRALQTDCCRASPPTYDCSPAVALATAVLDGRRSYFSKREVCVYAHSSMCVFMRVYLNLESQTPRS